MGHRTRFLSAAVAWGAIVVLITESLSSVRILTPTAIFLSWIACSLIALILGIPASRLCRCRSEAPTAKSAGMAKWRALVSTLAMLAILAAVVGAISAPSNPDSMTYHLVRVMHWIQNRSVMHYATGDLTQLYHGPWAEFAILHLQLLTNGDRFAFGVQWWAMAVCAVGASLLAEQLGSSRRGAMLATVFVMTAPATVLQAYSTQNNLVVSAWLICAAVAMLRLSQNSKRDQSASINVPQSLAIAVLFGASIGLAVLTKGTAYLFGLPLVLWFVAVCARHGGRHGSALVLVAGIVACTLNACHWSRNWRSFGSVLMPSDQATVFRNSQVTPRLIAANAVNNLSLELRTGIPPIDSSIRHAAARIQQLLSVKGEDPRIALHGHSLSLLPRRGFNEDIAGNPIHLIILLGAMGVIVVRAAKRTVRIEAVLLTVAVVSGFLLFSAFVKWQMFHCRLHLPLLILAAPLVGIVFDRIGDRLATQAAAWGLTCVAFGIIVLNPGHPLLGRRSIFRTPRESQYFSLRPGLYEPYRRGADILTAHGCNQIGITSGPVWEYPLWIMLRDRQGRWPHFESVSPSQPVPAAPVSRSLAFCAVVAIPADSASEETFPPPLDWPMTALGRGVKLFLRP